MDPRPAEPRQRWRLVVARDTLARDLLHRDVVTAWEAGLRGSGLPVSMSEAATPRPRITFAAPAPLGVVAERELMDVVLTELMLIGDVRAAVEAAAPVGYRLVDLFDVWRLSPTLASLVTAGDYRATVTVEAGVVPAEEIEVGIAALLSASAIEHVRTRGHDDMTVDIRPALLELRSVGIPSTAPAGAAGSIELWMRLRLGGEGAIGRPEEIVAALGERLGRRLELGRVTRERIVLADDPDV